MLATASGGPVAESDGPRSASMGRHARKVPPAVNVLLVDVKQLQLWLPGILVRASAVHPGAVITACVTSHVNTAPHHYC